MSIEVLQSEVSALPTELRRKLMAFMVALEDQGCVKEEKKIQKLWAVEALRRRDDVRNGRVKTIPDDKALARVRKAVAR